MKSFFSTQLALIHSCVSKKTEIRTNKFNERGVFATEEILAHEIIVIFIGKVFTSKQFEHIPDELKHYALQISDTAFLLSRTDRIDDFDAAELINHSCDPNAGILGNTMLVAMRDIKPGEEICYDYAMSDTTDADSGWDCLCESRLCRKKITPHDWKLKDLQQRYGIFFSTYILEKIAALKLQ
jgi:SET domain-containing protein